MSQKLCMQPLAESGQVCSLATAELYLYHGDVKDARFEFEACLLKNQAQAPVDCLADLGDPRRKIPFDALRCLADTYVLLDDEDMALNLLHAALEGATEMDVNRIRAECMVGIGDVMVRLGHSVEASQMWKAACPLFVKSSRLKDASVVGRLATCIQPDTDVDLPKVYSAFEKLTIHLGP
ncbi:hypothetical protein C8R44DRAFT_885713 [Mycena epipterygia]|nr:hypothetical protein C8R44DRAFT_885713 [Mycena epipterygia]